MRNHTSLAGPGSDFILKDLPTISNHPVTAPALFGRDNGRVFARRRDFDIRKAAELNI
jgi:hypothetical protein